jgi:chromosomal replication initiator protein
LPGDSLSDKYAAEIKDFFDLLKKQIHTKNWDLWFTTFEIKKIDRKKKRVFFVVGNLFIKEWVKNKYESTIEKCVKQKFGEDFGFEIDFSSREEEIQTVDSTKKKDPIVTQKPLSLSVFNSQYTFERFVVGKGNSFAYESATQVSKNPGTLNPFFLYGGVGLGKTHLLQSVGQFIMGNMPGLKVIYATSEQFMNELIVGIKTNSVEKFRDKYRNKIDILLLDDVQFLIGKKGIQNELFHTFNYLLDGGKQIVFCSDRTPEDLGTFHQRLVSRFQMGLVVEICAPDIETRERIIRDFMVRESFLLSEDIISFLSKTIVDNVRRIYGYLVKLLMINKLQGKEISLPYVQTLVEKSGTLPDDMKNVQNIKPNEKIFELSKKLLGISKDLLVSDSRKKTVSETRMIVMYASNKFLGISVTEISEWFQKAHSSVNYSINKISENLKKGHVPTKEKIDILQKALKIHSNSANA